MEIQFHLRARAVVFKNKKLLVTKFRNGQNTFLVGGRVEPGESIPTALQREILEELGVGCDIKNYLGAIENKWQENNVTQWEVNHYFEVYIPDLNPENPVRSMEEKYEYFWIDPGKMTEHNLLPLPLRDLINKKISGDTSV